MEVPNQSQPQDPADPADEPQASEYSYLFQATSADGKRVVDRVNASSAREALQSLEAAGYTNAELLTDDSDRFGPLAVPADKRWSPALEARLMTLPPLALWMCYSWHTSKLALVPMAISAVLLIQRRMEHTAPSAIDALLSVAFIAPIAFAIARWRGSLGYLERTIQKEYLAGRYERVLELVAAFESQAAHFKPLLPAFNQSFVALWRGRSLAKLNRLAEALNALEPLLKEREFKPIQYWTLRAFVFGAAWDVQGAVDSYRVCTQLEPNNPIPWLCMAEYYGRDLAMPNEARECLRRVQTLPLNPNLQQGITYTEGVVLLSEGSYPEAKRCFEEYMPYSKRQCRSIPLARGALALLQAQLAIACSRVGDQAAAVKHFKAAESILEISGAKQLLARCRREVLGQ